MGTPRAGSLGVQLNGADPNPNPNRMNSAYAWYQADPGAHDLSSPSAGPPPPASTLLVGGPSDGPNLREWTQSGAPFGSLQTQFHVTAGSLPPGIKLVQKEVRAPLPGGFNPWPVGVLNEFGWAGVPTELGVFNVTIGASGAFGGEAFTWTIGLAAGCPLIDITPEELDDLLVGGTYAAIPFAAANGTGPYVWDVADGALPDGLALSSGGVLSGEPTTPGVYTVAIRATDANDCPGILELTITVVDPDPIVVGPPTLEEGTRGTIYLADLSAEGGAGGPYTFTVEDGALPPGLALTSAGILHGLLTSAGAFTFTVRATDLLELFGEREYTIAIAGIRIMIGGVDVTIEIDACEIELGLNRQATARLAIGDEYIPARGAAALIYARDGVTPIFGGLVLARRIGGMADNTPANRGDVDLVDYSIYFEDADPVTIVSTVIQDLEDVITAIVDQALAPYGITYPAAPTGITVPPIEWTAITVPDAFKRITDATGIVFRVLPLKELDIFRPLDPAAPVSITDANLNAFALSWADPPNLPRNTVDLLCGPTGNGVTTQQWTADGIETSWEVDIQAVIGDYFPGARSHAFLGPTGASNFAAGETVTLGSSTYTFRASLVGDVAGEVLIGAGINASLANLAAAIIGAGGGGYAPSTPVNADADGYMRYPDQLAVNALAIGVAGDAIAVATSSGAAFWYGEGTIPLSTLQLGADPAGAAGWTQGYILENGATAQTLGAGATYEWDVTAGRGTVSLGTGATPAAGTLLELVYLAVFPFHARVPASLPPGTAPITFREDHPEIVSYAAGVALATQILVRESSNARELEVFTDVDGFLPGQELEVDTTYRGGLVASFLVATVRVHLVNAELWEYRLTTQESDEYAGSYVEQWKALTSGEGSSASSTPGTLTAGGPINAGDIYSDGRTSFRANQSLGGNKLTFVDDPDDDQDAATKGYVDASIPPGVILADGSVPFAADQSMGGFTLTDVLDPVDAQDAATKAYVDLAAGDGSPVTASVYRATDQTLAHNTEAAIAFSNAAFDDFSMWSGGAPTRLTVVQDGDYEVIGQITLGTGFAGQAHVRLYKNGTLVAEGTAAGGDQASGDERHGVTWLGRLVATDYLEMKVLLFKASASGTFDVVGGAAKTFLQAAKESAGAAAAADIVLTDDFASRPAAGVEGRLFLPEDGFTVDRDNASVWTPWGPLFPFHKPSDTGFSWVNQGSATLTDSKNALTLRAPHTGATGNLVLRVKSKSAPYTITAAILFSPNVVKEFTGGGIVFRQSSDGKLHALQLQASGAALNIFSGKWTNATTFSAAYASTTIPVRFGPIVFLRIADDNSDRKVSFSSDGQNWVLLHTIGRTDFLTADQVGFFVSSANNAAPNLDIVATLLSWEDA
jgi:hypothetical protein